MPRKKSRNSKKGLLDTRQFVIVVFSILFAMGAAGAAGHFALPGQWNPAAALAAFPPSFVGILAALHGLIEAR